ncbi:tRNA-guanin [Sesbania bispinosa]|nr:tRNA-guanin [Sesbania bispinosa]
MPSLHCKTQDENRIAIAILQMKFVVKKAWSSGVRVGALEIGNCPGMIETPALLLSTRKGLPHFISPDLLTSLPSPDSHLLQVSPLHFLEGLSPNTISKIGGLHQMLSLHEYGIAAVPRDSIQCLPEAKGVTKYGASFETPCGRLLIKPKDYVEMISCMRPNIWATLADEVPAWVSDKRNRTSVDRTLRWLDDCLALNPAVGSVFGAIVGGLNLDERKRCAEEVAKRNVSGYWIGGFGLGEGIDERPALLSTIVDVLPDEKPRMICGLGLPEEILQGVAAGIDLFDSTYIYSLTLGGFALTFSLDKSGNQDNFQLSQIGSDLTKINLRATVFSTSGLTVSVAIVYFLTDTVHVQFKNAELAKVVGREWNLVEGSENIGGEERKEANNVWKLSLIAAEVSSSIAATTITSLSSASSALGLSSAATIAVNPYAFGSEFGVLAPSSIGAVIAKTVSTGIVEEKQIEEGEGASTGGSFLIPFFLPEIREVSTTILEWKSSPDPFNFGSFSSINLSRLPPSAYSKSKHVKSDEDIEDVVDEQEKVDDTEEDKIIESDVELEGKIIEPDDDPRQKMGDPSVEVTDENREASQSAKANAMEAISEGKFEEAIENLIEAKSPKDRTILAQDAIGVVITAAAEDMEHACIMFDEMHKRSSSVSVTLVSREAMLPLFSRAVKFGYITYNLYSHSFLHFGLNAVHDSFVRTNMCKFTTNAGLGPPIEKVAGVFSDTRCGGYNIKTGLGYSIELMKFDMSGSADAFKADSSLPYTLWDSTASVLSSILQFSPEFYLEVPIAAGINIVAVGIAVNALGHGGDHVLNIGFGIGLVDTTIQQNAPVTHYC